MLFEGLKQQLMLLSKEGKEFIPLDDLMGSSSAYKSYESFRQIRRILVENLKKLHDLGTYVVGRKGYPTRFVFKKHPDLIPFPFPLSNGKVIRLELPPEMPDADIDRLCAYFQSMKLGEPEHEQGARG